MTNKWKYDRKLTAMMVEDCLIDPKLAAKIILGIRLPPHQEIRLYLMWFKSMFLDDSGFSTGKSTTIAIACALRSCLLEDRVSGIISSTFRQGQLISSNLDKWKDSSSIFRSCIARHRNQLMISHSTTGWKFRFNSNSEVRTLPPGVVQDSVRLKSERWNDGYFDEWNTFPVDTLTKTLFGRVSKLNVNPMCPVRQNHKALFSTPEDESSPSYKLVEDIDNQISEKSKDHAHFTSNYRHIPLQRKWIGFVDYKTIIDMQRFNPKSIVESEVDGKWRKSSITYYPKELIDECRVARVEDLFKFKREKQDDIIVFGFDMARGASAKNKRRGKGDDFSISVLIKSKSGRLLKLSHLVRKNGINHRQASWIIRLLFDLFNPNLIGYDPLGGGSFVAEELERSITQDPEGNIIEVVPIVDCDDIKIKDGAKILVPFARGNSKVEKLFKKQKSDSIIYNKLHNQMYSFLEDKLFAFPEVLEMWENVLTRADPRNMRKYLNDNKNFRGKERIQAEMDLAVTQIHYIDIERDKNKIPILDSFGMYKFTSRQKKDAAYSILYGFFAYLVLKIEEEEKEKDKKRKTSSFAIGAY